MDLSYNEWVSERMSSSIPRTLWYHWDYGYNNSTISSCDSYDCDFNDFCFLTVSQRSQMFETLGGMDSNGGIDKGMEEPRN